ncbi:MAG: hypothetical protein R3231_09140 [bacterium]|nr:hypothetical protein [bacterium]
MKSHLQNKGTEPVMRKILPVLLAFVVCFCLVIPWALDQAEAEEKHVVRGKIERVFSDSIRVNQKTYYTIGVLLLNTDGEILSRHDLKQGKTVAIYSLGRTISSILIYSDMVE